MISDGAVGTVAGLWRFPVKSMAGEALEAMDLTPAGPLGDRAFAIIDVATGNVLSASSVRKVPGILDCRATFAEPPRPGRELPPVRITLPDGQIVASGSPTADRALSAHFRHEVRLARADAVDQKMGAAFFDEIGMASPESVGAFVDAFPVSVLTTATLARLAELYPRSTFDLRRFRMNIIIGTDATGFPENEWVGRGIALGDAVRLHVSLPDPRRVVMTLPQDGLPSDPDVLKTVARHNSLEIGAGRRYPCAGVYTIVASPGTLRLGDRVSIA